jgi:hypothetical protein
MSVLTEHSMKRGDRMPSLKATLGFVEGTNADLTGCTVRFLMRGLRARGLKVAADAVVVSPKGGVVRYDWAAGDTDTSGVWLGEFEVTETSSGRKQSFPNNGYLSVVISESIV